MSDITPADAPRELGDDQAEYAAAAAKKALTEQGRRLASRREELVAAGADSSELEVPVAPGSTGGCDCETCAAGDDSWCCRTCHDLAREEESP